MKKIIMMLLALVLGLPEAGNAMNSSEISIGDSIWDINKKYTPFISCNFLNVYKIDDRYIVVIAYGDIVQKKAEFSETRESSGVEGLTLVRVENIQQYLNRDFCEVMEELGSVHVDIGSGLSIPVYITEDGHMITFRADQEIGPVILVSKHDILSDTSVEEYIEPSYWEDAP